MLEGLEAVEISKSRISSENDIFRLDSQYFKKEYLKEDSNRKRFNNKYLGQIAFITDGQHGYHEVDENSPIRHLTAKNAKGWFANDVDADRIAKWVDDNNLRSSLEKDDLILSTRGTVGLCAIVDSDVLPSNIDQDVARIKIESNVILPTVALSYLNCKVGQDWLERNQTGMVQQGIALWRVREIPLPIFSDKFQNVIDGIIKNSRKYKDNSKQTYAAAETLLLETIGLNNFEPSTDPINVKNFKESFWATGRLDAEYYQKKYEDYIKLICRYPNGYEALQILCNQKDNNFTPEDKTEYKYIELADIGKSGEIKSCTIAQGAELPTRARRKVNTNDVVVSSIEGSLDSCALVTEEYNNALCSTGFYVINSKKINSETLLVLFKSEPMQNILKQNCSGTILTAINKTEFQNIHVPLIDKSIQEIIKDKISESFKLKKQSEQLLETAKRAVELAIEKDEKTAIEFIKRSSVAVNGIAEQKNHRKR
ncbi:MAG: restriction endonuclease subunit S [Ignavibacteriaceae bacterium]|nr:restriction endonuclease subunit S [Ignavibacteriaceae bacterium]